MELIQSTNTIYSYISTSISYLLSFVPDSNPTVNSIKFDAKYSLGVFPVLLLTVNVGGIKAAPPLSFPPTFNKAVPRPGITIPNA
ncbi:hypothetical protein LX64_03344 [Chitinophaga skermanii]|uniref:Uncharacterized protein n=1 Tax=Chitinophaga skermanii TaxID=331697 RepID=A0A327QG91_9BACT|nr:hypothetical protein LX64_03344 [Chitinophaga skermanii]